LPFGRAPYFLGYLSVGWVINSGNQVAYRGLLGLIQA
jgi:hypothetical protein